MEIRKYEDGDMQYVRENAFQDEVKNYPDLPVPEHSYTCIFEGEIVAVGGVKMYFEGVCESWIMLTKQSKKDGVYGLIACRAIEKKLNELIVDLKIRRCEANVRKDFPIAIRFVEALGFKFVGEREQWFPDLVSAMLYSKVRDGYGN